MAVRQCISGPDIPEHVNPFPAGVKIGNMVFSAAIGGDDPDTHELPEDEESQIGNAFRTMRNMLRRAGTSNSNSSPYSPERLKYSIKSAETSQVVTSRE